MKHLLALVLLVVVVDRAVSDCCTPSQWEGSETLFGTKVTGGFGLHTKLYQSVLHVSYDADNDMKAISGNITSTFLGSKIKIVYNYTEGVRYTIYPDVETCRVKDLKSEFRKSCVPSDAKLLEETYIGVEPSTLPVKVYRVVGDHTSIQSTVTDNCVPVDEVVVDAHMNKVYTDMYKFFDLTMGIADPDVFSVPDYCEEAAEDERLEGVDVNFFSANRLFRI